MYLLGFFFFAIRYIFCFYSCQRRMTLYRANALPPNPLSPNHLGWKRWVNTLIYIQITLTWHHSRSHVDKEDKADWILNLFIIPLGNTLTTAERCQATLKGLCTSLFTHIFSSYARWRLLWFMNALQGQIRRRAGEGIWAFIKAMFYWILVFCFFGMFLL